LTIASGVIAARNGAGKKLTFAEARSAVQAAIANAIFNALGGCAEVPFTRSGSKRPSLDGPEDSTDQKKPGRLSGGRAVRFTAAMLTAVVIELSLILPELPPVSL